ncbi:MAG: hypothetical protein PHD09_07980, partial [Candidatus Omnitrophica bacterium]|nr:hypothetical protein [Candidatus Omnitrophota bacterium]
ATNNDANTWSYLGPDGTSDTYYSTATGETISSSNDGDRYLRYKGTFLSTNGTASATLHEIIFVYSDYSGTQTYTAAGHHRFYATDPLDLIKNTATDFSAGTLQSTEVIGQNESGRVSIAFKNTWGGLTNTGVAVSHGSGIAWGGGDYIYALMGGNTQTFRRYSISGNSWADMTDITGATQHTGNNLVWTGGDYIYALRGNSTANFYRYSISGNNWDTMTDFSYTASVSASLVWTGGDYIYGTQGGGGTGFARYSISGNSWTTISGIAVNAGSGLAYPGSGDYLYMTKGDNTTTFYRFDTVSNAWAQMASAPGNFRYGGDLEAGNDGYIYGFLGNNTNTFYRYDAATNSWTTMTSTGQIVHYGGAMTYGNGYLYAMYGNSSQYFYRYGGYYSSGYYTSPTYDLGQASNFSTISFAANVPSGTELKFQIATNNDANTWSYLGPDGTSDTYYSTATGETISSSNDGDRYLRYKGTFLSTNGTASATLYSITISAATMSGYREIMNINASGQLMVSTIYGSNASYGNLVLRSTTDAGKGNVLLADGGGYVGIGTDSPLGVLHVGGTSDIIFNTTGNVGIKTTSPTAALDVRGNAIVSGNLTPLSANTGSLGTSGVYWNSVYSYYYYGKTGSISAFDVAEEYPVLDTTIEPGDVVSATSSQIKLSLEKSTRGYDNNLVGVISTEPGIILEDWENPSEIPTRLLSLVGRVPVKVSLENGPIAIGDYLTSASSIPGFAMKATEAGRVIGMALEPFNGTTTQCHMEIVEPTGTATSTATTTTVEVCESVQSEIGKITVFVNPHWRGGTLDSAGSLALSTSTSSSTTSTSSDESLLSGLLSSVIDAITGLPKLLVNGILEVKDDIVSHGVFKNIVKVS